MSLPLLAHYVNELMLRLLQMQIAVLCAFQAIGVLKQPLERGTVSGLLSECSKSEIAPTVDPLYSTRLGFQRVEGRQSMSPRHSSSECESTGDNHASTSASDLDKPGLLIPSHRE